MVWKRGFSLQLERISIFRCDWPDGGAPAGAQPHRAAALQGKAKMGFSIQIPLEVKVFSWFSVAFPV